MLEFDNFAMIQIKVNSNTLSIKCEKMQFTCRSIMLAWKQKHKTNNNK